MDWEIKQGECLAILRRLDDESVDCVVTSPPYWGLRDYGVTGQIGLEKTPEQYVEKLVIVFREVRRVLSRAGTLWLNLGDSYAGSWGAQGRQGKTGVLAGRTAEAARQVAAAAKKRSGTGSIPAGSGLKPTDLVGIPWRVAFALRTDGWFLRSDIIWHKRNPMPESVKNRPTKSHEYLFLFAKSRRYFYDGDAIKEPCEKDTQARYLRARGKNKWSEGPGKPHALSTSFSHMSGDRRNKRSVWTMSTQAYPGAHFATFPPKLIEPCILAGCPAGGIVLDPFAGSGTTGAVALAHRRRFLGIELNPKYITLAERRIRG